MQRVAKFEKVSFEQYKRDCAKQGWIQDDEVLRKEWESIKLPTRATSGSAGYDFYSPWSFPVTRGAMHVPTGIRCKIEPGWFLMCCPKSGLGFKHRMRLANTIGVIDSDYYNSDNEGHIQAKFSSYTPFEVEQGQKFMQGIFIPYGVTEDDDTDGIRNGGFGSTGA